MHQFEIGSNYAREQVLGFLGSKQPVSGIVYGQNSTDYVAIFTGGRSGKPAGYTDGWSEGVFRYCGQGSKGDQRLSGANSVLSRHEGTVLIFETWKPRHSWKGQQRFLGNFRIIGHEFVKASGVRSGDQLLIFSLIPTAGPSPELLVPVTISVDISELRSKARAAARPIAPTRNGRVEYRERSNQVALYVLARAAGTCEACGMPAPFRRQDGTPFLEVHHTRRLADDGPDDPYFVAGICPNCHREAHHGADIDGFRLKLEVRIKSIENDFELKQQMSRNIS